MTEPRIKFTTAQEAMGMMISGRQGVVRTLSGNEVSAEKWERDNRGLLIGRSPYGAAVDEIWIELSQVESVAFRRQGE